MLLRDLIELTETATREGLMVRKITVDRYMRNRVVAPIHNKTLSTPEAKRDGKFTSQYGIVARAMGGRQYINA